MRDGDEPMTEARTLTPLDRLAEHRQSVWLDQISRELVGSGDLERLIRERNVTGLTSNPTIFAKAIADGRGYDEQLRELIRSGLTDADALRIGSGTGYVTCTGPYGKQLVGPDSSMSQSPREADMRCGCGLLVAEPRVLGSGATADQARGCCPG